MSWRDDEVIYRATLDKLAAVVREVGSIDALEGVDLLARERAHVVQLAGLERAQPEQRREDRHEERRHLAGVVGGARRASEQHERVRVAWTAALDRRPV